MCNSFTAEIALFKSVRTTCVRDMYNQWRIEGGRGGGAFPPTAQIFLNFMQFFGKFGKIVYWRPPRRVRAPLLRRILDLPLKAPPPPK